MNTKSFTPYVISSGNKPWRTPGINPIAPDIYRRLAQGNPIMGGNSMSTMQNPNYALLRERMNKAGIGYPEQMPMRPRKLMGR